MLNTVREDDDGNLEIPNLDMLLATVAVARVLAPVQLVGAELRFLRHVLHLTGTEFARAIDLSDKTVVSRWENGKSRPGGYTEKIIRQLILNVLAAARPVSRFQEMRSPVWSSVNARPRKVPLPMAFSFKSRSGSEGQSIDCYAEAA